MGQLPVLVVEVVPVVARPHSQSPIGLEMRRTCHTDASANTLVYLHACARAMRARAMTASADAGRERVHTADGLVRFEMHCFQIQAARKGEDNNSCLDTHVGGHALQPVREMPTAR
jgi:hypothetical protein